MYEDGLPTEVVLGVLKAHGLKCYPQGENPAMTVVSNGNNAQAYKLGKMVSKHLIVKLGRKWGVATALFYNS
jgi:hypothetical protein